MTFFDSAFILARVDQCIAICENLARHGFDNPKLFIKAFEQGLSWLNNHGHKTGLLPHDLSDIEDHLLSLNQTFLIHNSLLDLEEDEFLEQVQTHNDEVKQVSEPVASAQLPVFRLLGQRFTTYPLCDQNNAVSIPSRLWFTRPVSIPVTKQFLSNTRSVGGLA